MSREETFYKIKRADGLFSTGGTSPRFTTIGKTWRGLGPLKRHLNIMHQYKGYLDCYLVTIEMVESSSEPMINILAEREEVLETRQKERDARIKKWREDMERRKLEELQAKYG